MSLQTGGIGQGQYGVFATVGTHLAQTRNLVSLVLTVGMDYRSPSNFPPDIILSSFSSRVANRDSNGFVGVGASVLPSSF